ncbi:MAG: PAS domain S-box protein [Promethearchaeota archaeon]
MVNDSGQTPEKILDDLLLDISSELDPKSLLSLILEKGCEIFQLEYALMVFWRASLGVVMAAHGFPRSVKIQGSIVKSDQGLAGQVFRGKKIVVVQNYSKRAEAYPPLKNLGLDLAFAAPLFARNETIGSICFYSKEANRELTPRELGYLDRLAKQASIAILNAQLFQELEENTRKISETRNYLDLLIDHSPDVIVDLDLSGKVTYWNSTAETVFGHSKEEMVGSRLPLLPGKSTEKFQELFLRARKGEPLRQVRVFFRGKGGSKVLVALNLIPVKNPNTGKVGSILLTGHDITGERRLQVKVSRSTELLEERNAQLELALKELEGAQERLSQAEKLSTVVDLADGLSHEVNNPLMGIINYAQILLDELPDAEAFEKAPIFAEFLHGILEECKKIEHITKGLSTLSRFEMYEEYRPTKVQDALDEAIASLSGEFEANGIELEKRYEEQDGGIPPIIGRFELLVTAFQTLLENSLAGIRGKGKPGGVIKVKLETRDIDRDPHVSVEIEDTGVPFPAEFIPRLFDPFPRLGYSDCPRIKRGLDMTIVLSAVKNHNGYIEVETTPRGNTRFTILIPVQS